MNRTKFLAAGLLGFGLAAFAQGQTTEPEKVTLTVDQAVEYALQNSRDLKSNDIDLAIKERSAKYSWNVFLPEITVSGTAARTTNIDSTLQSVNGSAQMMQMIKGLHPDFPLSEVSILEAEEKYHWALVGSVNAQLNLSLAYIYSIKAAKAEYEGGKITWEQSQKQTVMNIKKLFYGLLLQQESLSIQRMSLENARQRAAQAQVNFNNGRIPQLQVLNAQVTYENQRPEVETAEQSLNQQLDTLAFLIGMPVGTKIELSGSIEPEYVNVTAEELLEKYGKKSLDVRSLQNNIDILNMNLKALNLSSYTPALVLSYGWQPAGSWWGGDLDFSDQGSLSITLAFNITNMLPWSANRQKARDLKDNISKLNLTMDTLTENQKVQVRKAVDTLNQARDQIDSMGRTVELARRSYDMSVNSFNNGLMELLDVRDAQTQLNQAMLGQLNQKYNYVCALMDLENTLNIELSNSQAAGQN
ncbi:MAG: TolC family protein [Treponemataceae bacterium]|nr:TolC family protein [Treponemataceae bacterium]MDE7392233.1 TolC family protein [Treponemataceae bacterium]